MLDVRQMGQWAGYMQALGWKVERLGRGKRTIQAYVRPLKPLPISVMKVQRISATAFDGGVIRGLAKKYRAVVTYVEFDDPRTDDDGWEGLTDRMKREGFAASMNAMLPTKSRWVDLTQPPQTLLGEMKAKTRYNIGLAKKRQVRVRWLTGKDLLDDSGLMEAFWDMFARNNRRIGMMGIPRKWFEAHMQHFKERVWVATAYVDSELVAGAVFFKSDDGLVYYYNGSTARGRHDMAPTLIVWEAIERGKKAGLDWLDFEGIEDERKPNKRWSGFSRFKAGFGGRTVYYPPVYVRWFFDTI